MTVQIGILTGRGPACDELQMWLDTVPGLRAEQIHRVPGNQIPWQRNCIAERLLASDDEALLYVDADCVPPRGAVERLLATRLPIVSGTVIERIAPFAVCATKNFEPYVRYTTLDLQGRAEPFPVVAVGAGCLLVRRDVFEKLERPWFRCGQLSSEVLAEDTEFCLRAAEAGFPPYLDPRVLVGHELRGMIYPGDDGQLWVRWPGPFGLLPYKQPLGCEVPDELHL